MCEEDLIPIDTDGSDRDSAYGDSDVESDTTSLRSAIIDYHYENGRRYHAYRRGAYWGPNDEQAALQLDIGHHIWNLTLNGRLVLAPIPENTKEVLDVGTGTGIWAIDFADQHPSAQVTGTDLSPIQPSFVPPNLQFEIDDCCSEWTYPENKFDFIHVRGLYGCVADWPAFYKQVLTHLKPGGWFQQSEMGVVPRSEDGTVAPDSIFAAWGNVSLEAGDVFGKSLRIVDEGKQHLIDAGFTSVAEHRFKWPIGGWSRDPRLKEIGAYNRLQWEEGIEGWCTYLLTNYLNWSREEIDVYLAKMRGMLRDRSVHAYQDASCIYGQKPFEKAKEKEEEG